MESKSVRPVGCVSAGQMARECIRVEGKSEVEGVEWSVNGKLDLSGSLSLLVKLTDMLLP